MTAVAAATGYQGLWTTIHGASAYSTIGALTQAEQDVRRTTRSRGDKAMMRRLYALIGAAAGGTALQSISRRSYQSDIGGFTYGGLATIVVDTPINRVTTAADVTDIKAILDARNTFATYPVDRSGNGGGGKRGV